MSLTRHPRLQVILLERGQFPRRKVCGSGLSPWALTLLDRLGVGPRIRKEAYPIRAGIVCGSQGQRVELRGQYEAAVLLRERLDTLLAHEAARRGAQLREGIRVESLLRDHGRLQGVKTSAGEIEADAVIVCNGAGSRLAPAHRPGQTLQTILGWYEGLEGISDSVELYFDAIVKPYYGWVFPESPSRVNVGICYAPRPGGPNARQRFEVFLERRLAKRMKYATSIGGLVGHPVATSYEPASLVAPGTLLAGEAGRLVDPATAEGIHHALASGWLAGNYLGAILEEGGEPTPQRLRPYTQLVRQRIGPRLRTGQLFLHLTRTPALDLVLRLGSMSWTRSLLTWLLAGA
jgi:flavin-dependent dehydrogenase